MLPTLTSALAESPAVALLGPLDAGEVGRDRLDALWLRGGFPDSLLAASGGFGHRPVQRTRQRARLTSN